ncbi:MAG TPA: glycosyltransferase family 1 protein, partial [Blastocatellia bacterium]|nr:glycosyltransferase family 1 protein [Blastocatellia bacterium]
ESRAHARTARVAIICDLVEEEWPSMELVAEMLVAHLSKEHSDNLTASRICPEMRRRFSRSRLTGAGGASNLLSRVAAAKASGLNADRLINRMWDYPRYLRRARAGFDLFHLVDHSYAQLVHELPPERTIVTCHDLDTFQSVLNPSSVSRSSVFRAMTRRILEGLEKAARVTCDSQATRDALLAYDLLPPDRMVVVENGVHPSCSPVAQESADAEAGRLLGRARGDRPEILHVGSTIARKRIDVLLEVFARVRKQFPGSRLVRVGGPFTAEQSKQVDRLGIRESIVVLPFLDRPTLAAVYRRAAILVQPSEGEGFGLPVVEAMACGAPVITSDLAVLKEVGGRAAAYCPVADVAAWSEAAARLLAERRDRPELWRERVERAIAHAAGFSWSEYARKMAGIYREVLEESSR